MCKIHHAAYDVDIFGIDTSYKVAVRNESWKRPTNQPSATHFKQSVVHKSTFHQTPQHAPTENCSKCGGNASKTLRENRNAACRGSEQGI
jgi:hypothetical protein